MKVWEIEVNINHGSKRVLMQKKKNESIMEIILILI